MIHLDAGVALEHLAHQIHDAPGTGGAVEQRRLRLLCVFHEFLQVTNRNGRMRQQQHRHIGADRDRHEVLLDVVLRAADKLQRRRGGGEGDVVEQQRVAVGSGLGDLVGANRSAGTTDVLHHHALAQPLRHPLRKKPRQHIGGSARRERHDDADVSRGKPLLTLHRSGDQRRSGEHGGADDVATRPAANRPLRCGVLRLVLVHGFLP